eukprot:gene5238-8849_t
MSGYDEESCNLIKQFLFKIVEKKMDKSIVLALYVLFQFINDAEEIYQDILSFFNVEGNYFTHFFQILQYCMDNLNKFNLNIPKMTIFIELEPTFKISKFLVDSLTSLLLLVSDSEEFSFMYESMPIIHIISDKISSIELLNYFFDQYTCILHDLMNNTKSKNEKQKQELCRSLLYTLSFILKNSFKIKFKDEDILSEDNSINKSLIPLNLLNSLFDLLPNLQKDIQSKIDSTILMFISCLNISNLTLIFSKYIIKTISFVLDILSEKDQLHISSRYSENLINQMMVLLKDTGLQQSLYPCFGYLSHDEKSFECIIKLKYLQHIKETLKKYPTSKINAIYSLESICSTFTNFNDFQLFENEIIKQDFVKFLFEEILIFKNIDSERRIDLIQVAIQCLLKLTDSKKILTEIIKFKVQLSEKLIKLVTNQYFEFTDSFYYSSFLTLFLKCLRERSDEEKIFFHVDLIIDDIFKREEFLLFISDVLNLFKILYKKFKDKTRTFFKEKNGFVGKLKQVQNQEEDIDAYFSSHDLGQVLKTLK